MGETIHVKRLSNAMSMSVVRASSVLVGGPVVVTLSS
jgi:hypothetical protein